MQIIAFNDYFSKKQKLFMNKTSRTIIAGIVGTAVMTLVIFLAPKMGLPKMSPPEMLAGMMGLPIIAGWIMHFLIGIIFAFGYSYLFAPKTRIKNLVVKGAIYGFLVFIFAQLGMAMMGSMMADMPAPELPLQMALGSLIGHLVYGIGVSITAGK